MVSLLSLTNLALGYTFHKLPTTAMMAIPLDTSRPAAEGKELDSLTSPISMKRQSLPDLGIAPSAFLSLRNGHPVIERRTCQWMG